MREIKFRQAIFVKGEFSYFHYWGFISSGQFASPETNSSTIEGALKNSQQFTGLHDKNGKPIFEGDIVKTVFGGETLIGEIRYADKWVKFYFAAKNKNGSGIAFDPTVVFDCYWADDDDEEGTSICEVIGDIYTTPELLEGKG